jgi:hypothetical protein
VDGEVLKGVISEELLRSKPIQYIESYEEPITQAVTDTEKASYEKIKETVGVLGVFLKIMYRKVKTTS